MVPAVAIKDHDMVYWIGDLNYRITDIDLDLVKENIRQNKLEDLYQADQLRNQIYRFELFFLFGCISNICTVFDKGLISPTK